MAFAVLMLCLAQTEAPASETLVFAMADDPLQVGGLELHGDEVRRVLRSRAGGARVDAESETARTRVHASTRGNLVVLDIARAGMPAVTRVVRANGRSERDLVHTVALVVAETVWPVDPGTTPLFAKPREEPVETLPETTATPPAEPSALSGWAHLGAGALVTLPEGEISIAGALGGAIRYRLVLIEAAIDVAPRHGVAAADYAVDAWQLGGYLGVGGVLESGRLRYSLSAGPALRVLALSARGDNVAFRSRTEWNGGVGALAAVSSRVGPVRLGIGLGLRVYASYPRVLVNGQRVFDGQPTALLPVFRLEYDL